MPARAFENAHLPGIEEVCWRWWWWWWCVGRFFWSCWRIERLRLVIVGCVVNSKVRVGERCKTSAPKPKSHIHLIKAAASSSTAIASRIPTMRMDTLCVWCICIFYSGYLYTDNMVANVVLYTHFAGAPDARFCCRFGARKRRYKRDLSTCCSSQVKCAHRANSEFGERGSDMKELVRYRFYIPFAAAQANTMMRRSLRMVVVFGCQVYSCVDRIACSLSERLLIGKMHAIICRTKLVCG